MTEKESLTAISSFVAFGPLRLKLILEYFGSAGKAWKAKAGEFRKIGISPALVSKYSKYRESFDSRGYFDRLKYLKVEVLTIFDDKYPMQLHGLKDKPLLLYVKGNVEVIDTKLLAIVGSRKMSLYGKNKADDFSRELSNLGFTIVSGLARGIDTVAHRAVVNSGGKTIAVLGSGIDRIYPSENESLVNDIVESEGAIISEYPLGYPPLPSNFVLRNRIISGISSGVLVVEGEKRSGTLITASHAANQGRLVFAIPGQIDSPLSEAAHFLIKNGAKLTSSIEDIVEEFEVKSFPGEVSEKENQERKILEILSQDSADFDKIVKLTSLEAIDVFARLTSMELKGVVKVSGKIYKKVKA